MLIIGAIISVAMVGCDCSHEWGEWIPTKDKTCLENGEAKRVCAKCGESETMLLPATGYHMFGEWITSGKYKQRTCTVCGYKEKQDNLDEKDDIDEQVTGVYGTFDRFLTDCSKNGNNVTYRGAADSISIDLASGTKQCDGYVIIIPNMVFSVKFIGRPQGSPFQDLKIVIADRSSNIDITFENVDIEARGTVINSESKKITVSLTMEGSLCSFVNTSKAERGANGRDNATGSINEVIENGRDGASGTPAIMINGTCNVYCKAQHLVVRGGEGGDGGDGTWSGWPGKASGNGGNGGCGGAAFAGDNLANIYALSGSTVEISGGSGGNGGNAGGNTAWFDQKYGHSGYGGSAGSTGCKSTQILAG